MNFCGESGLCVSQAGESIAFEQPLTERVRTFLRLEFLFGQHEHHRRDHSEFGVRATLHTMLDTLVVLSRSDLKNDILKELTDQHTHLTRLAARPNIDRDRLGDIRCPVLVTAGEMDCQVPPRYGRAVADAIPGARFHLFTGPHASHLACVEMADEFNRVTLDWLNAI